MRYFFRVVVGETQETLALCSLYSPADERYLEESNGALLVCRYEGEGRLIVIRVKTIISCIAMVPFTRGGKRDEFFVVEKPSIGVVHTGDDEY